MPPDIHPAQPQDAAAITKIDRQVNLSPWSFDQYRVLCASTPSRIQAPGLRKGILVAIDGEKIVGFIVYACAVDQGSIDNLAVALDDQGEGHGRRLVAAALGELRAMGAVCCLLEVRADNSVARGLYEAYGFHVDGTRKAYYRGPEGRVDACLMSLNLVEDAR
jgi:ribosomal-protein-alanine N-acetyltransferase